MIPQNAFPVRIRGRTLQLKTLSTYPESFILRAINVMEEYDHKEANLDDILRRLRNIFEDEVDLRKINLLFYALRVFYRALQPKIFPLRTKKGFLFKDAWSLKMHFYMWVQKSYGGFIPLESRAEALKNFSEFIGIKTETLELVLEYDIKNIVKIVRTTPKPPTPKEVIGVSNFLLLEKALSISDNATIIFFDVTSMGTLVKELLYRSKKSGLIIDFEIKKNNLICRLSGPYQLFKHPSPIYGDAIRYALVGSMAIHKNWKLRATIRYRKRILTLELSSTGEWKNIIPPWKYHGASASPQPFDSEPERKLYHILKRLFPEAIVKREPEIVSTPDGTIFIPDFTIEINGEKIYLELVGYWTERYAKKKREKLDKIYESGVKKLVAIIDKKNQKYFKHTKYPTIIYAKDLTIAKTLRETIEKLTKD